MKRKKIQHLRIENGLNQKEFAESLGVTGQYISLIENGSADGGPKFWYKLRTTYNIPSEELESYKMLS